MLMIPCMKMVINVFSCWSFAEGRNVLIGAMEGVEESTKRGKNSAREKKCIEKYIFFIVIAQYIKDHYIYFFKKMKRKWSLLFYFHFIISLNIINFQPEFYLVKKLLKAIISRTCDHVIFWSKKNEQ